ncbi:hypothetical protein [Mucisphaera calidilacus]|uniref:Lipoprotein n=1 Tax=Mucisphaera calidilacus TaxID=2527982 RepID=A0A518BW07_9BACT|nr:hypothetical protein [Mucisphaera calidilacus]QDU71162.1 hypothetical protein Pan265_10110 [Mucisphaera calidilacus]
MRHTNLVVLLLVTLLLPGCAFFGYTAAAVTGAPRIPAAYKLKVFPVLVMVDDPDEQLGSAGLTSQIAEMVGFYITENIDKRIDEDFIPAQRLSALADRLGREDVFPKTPIDVIGRELGAKEVVCVVIESAKLDMAPGMLRPQAAVSVTVVDVESGQRVYPESGSHRLEVKLKPMHDDRAGRATSRLASQKMAEDIALKVSKLFYKHWEAEPRR